MRTLSLIKVLLFYDQLLLFLGEDGYGCKYLCMLVECPLDTLPLYLCIPINALTLNELKYGIRDVRSVFFHGKEFYMANIAGDDVGAKTTPLSPYLEEIREEWLPEEGLFLDRDDFAIEFDESLALKQAYEDHCGVFHLHLDPVESTRNHGIFLGNLALVTSTLQSLLKHAYRKVVRREENIKHLFPEAYQIQVSKFSPGSVVIEMIESPKTKFMENLGFSKTLCKIDSLVQNSQDPQKTVDVLRENNGHLAKSYVRFLKCLLEIDSSLDYSWAVPSHKKASRGTINKRDIPSLIATIERENCLENEVVTFKGRFRKVDIQNASWTIWNNEDQKQYSGKLADDVGNILEGIVISTQLYQIRCTETLAVTSTGKEKTSLFLESISKI